MHTKCHFGDVNLWAYNANQGSSLWKLFLLSCSWIYTWQQCIFSLVNYVLCLHKQQNPFSTHSEKNLFRIHKLRFGVFTDKSMHIYEIYFQVKSHRTGFNSQVKRFLYNQMSALFPQVCFVDWLHFVDTFLIFLQVCFLREEKRAKLREKRCLQVTRPAVI